MPAHELSAGLAKRFDVREDDEPRLMRHKYQGILLNGYAELMRNRLADIPVMLTVDCLKERSSFHPRKWLVFSGPIDECLGYDLGRLRYRGQQREHIYLPEVDYAQRCGQVNNPALANGPHIRTLEWKQMLPREYAERMRGTVLTRETTITPAGADQYEYRFPDEQNARLYQEYRARAEQIPGLNV